MGQGFAYARENNGTREVVIKDSTGKDIAMSAFSGYLAFSGNLLKEGLSHADAVVKGTLLGKAYSIVDGVVSGVFDVQGNPDKSMNDVIGTAATAILVGEAGAGLGSLFGPIGTVIGGTLGGIAGAVWGEDAYNGIIEACAKAMDLADQAADFIISPTKDYKQKLYTDFAGALKYFNEDGTVNFAKYLADTANISLYDPIALDLNANGKIDTLSLENGVFFDHNGDGIAFKSSWISGEDGILARDINGDGKITSGAELFGNFTRLKNGELAKNGAEALKDLDDNNDGIFDSNDKAFNEILVWQDKNSDGISQKNELKTLNEHNIKSIDLEFMADNTALDKDNKQILIGSFSTNISNESKNNLASDIDFSVDTIQRNILDDTDGIIKGTGFVRNFNLSLNDEIKNAYESYKTLNTKQQQLSNVETLVNLWAKTAKQYKELDNPIQKAKINISSVASGTTSSGIDEAIKRAEAGEITLSDGVKISA